MRDAHIPIAFLLGTQSDKTLLQQAQAMEIEVFVDYIRGGFGSG
jgi:hypothetical protein